MALQARPQLAKRHKLLDGEIALSLIHISPCEFVGVQDRFGKSGGFEELLGYFNLDAAAIVEAVKRARGRK